MLDARVNGVGAYNRATAARPGAAKAGLERAQARAATIKAAIETKQKTMPGLQVRLSPLTGGAEVVRNRRGTLTNASGGSNETIARGFLTSNGGLYGLDAGDVSDMVVTGSSAGGRSGLRMVRMEQRIDGRPVFQSETRFLIDRSGRLVSSMGRVVPSARTVAPRVKNEELLTPAVAIAKLLQAEGRTVDAASFSVSPAAGEWIQIDETDDYAVGPIFARQMLFPLGPGQLVPVWALVVTTEGENDWYAMVDSETGDVLWRKNIRHEASTHDARFRVFVQADGRTPADSPAPGSPNANAVGSNTQFPFLPPTIVSMHAVYSPTASQNGWIDDCPGGICTANETQTLGNNVLACLDRTVGGAATNQCDVDANSLLDGNGRPTGNPDTNTRNRDFLGIGPRDFETNFLPPPQTTPADAEVGQNATGNGVPQTIFRRGAVTHLFYVTNWYHDELYALGFDEGSANFQQINFGGGPGALDRVLADAQDGSGTNNANFSTPPDGLPGRMQMFRFINMIVDRDGDLDADIIVHELTHGTSNRLVGNAAGLNWEPAGGMGEGWGDFYALSMLNNTNADDPNGQYPMGGYSTYKLAGAGFLDNYIYGIRRYPYTTNNSINPHTWEDIDDVTFDLTGGIPGDPRNASITGAMQVHNAGTIWANSLWEVRSRVIADPAGANGDVPTGNTTMLQIVTDGLKMTPIDPSFTDGRDALFDADCATNACANEASIWGGFADRGLGYKSAAPYRIIYGPNFSGHQSVHESFSVPYLDVLDPLTDVAIDDSASNNNGDIDPGEAFRLNVTLFNPWRAASKAVTAGAVATLTTSSPDVTIFDNTATYPAIAPQASAPGNDTFMMTLSTTALAGQSLDFSLSVTSNLGTTVTTFRLRVGTRNGTDPVVTYTRDTNPDLAIPDAPNAGGGRGVFDTMAVTDDYEIADIDFRADSVTHDFVGDLTLLLRSPHGTGVDFISVIDGFNDFGGIDLVDMVIDDDLPPLPENDMVQANDTDAPYTKSWLPVFNAPWTVLAFGLPNDPIGNLSYMDGESTPGTWSVFASDQFGPDTGTLNAWSILVTPVHFDITAFSPAVLVTSPTKTVSGTFEVGGTVTYTVTITNSGTDPQGDNAGDEFVDVLPSSLTLVSANATSGTAAANIGTNTVTWNGTLAPLGGSVTITITATVDAGTQGTVISNQGTVNYDSNNDNTNDASVLTDDPSVGGASDPTNFLVADAILTGTKVDSGTFAAGSTVTYTVTLNNTGSGASLDNAGDEFTDVLPADLTLVSANASSGTAVANVGTNTVTWNGSVPAAGSVTITITATIEAVPIGTVITNQGTINYDNDLDGTNESSTTTDDPAVAGANDPTSFTTTGATVTGTKTASGSNSVGGTVTYTITLTNSGTSGTTDNPGDEFTDVLPAGLTLVSANASSGTAVANVGTNTVTWNGSYPAGGSVTITITATIDSGTQGTTISNQGNFSYDADLDGTNESSGVTDDPSVAGTGNATVIAVAAALDTLTKTVAGTFEPNSIVTYTITITNTGDTASPDNVGDELTDVLPSQLTLVSANASSGTALANVGTNTVTWNGAVAAGGSVTITIQALLEPGNVGATISNQATLNYDSDGNGSNETTVLSDDPGTPAPNDPTSFVAAASLAGIPTVSEWGLLFLALGLAMMAAWKISRG
jgi:uncharacterized repeat protein (TIGR01451 family)